MRSLTNTSSTPHEDDTGKQTATYKVTASCRLTPKRVSKGSIRESMSNPSTPPSSSISMTSTIRPSRKRVCCFEYREWQPWLQIYKWARLSQDMLRPVAYCGQWSSGREFLVLPGCIAEETLLFRQHVDVLYLINFVFMFRQVPLRVKEVLYRVLHYKILYIFHDKYARCSIYALKNL